MTVREIKPTDVYNLMNDLRHLLILDTRVSPAFSLTGSFPISHPDLDQVILSLD